MDFSYLLKSRYSVRKYESAKVQHESLLQILEAARVAPSAMNKQPIKLIVVQDTEGMDKIKKTANIYNAPLAVIVCGDHAAAAVNPFSNKSTAVIDASIVIDHMMLQACALGLGSVWIGQFDPAVISKEFALPNHIEPVGILAIGHGAGKAPSPDRHDAKRIPLSELVLAGLSNE